MALFQMGLTRLLSKNNDFVIQNLYSSAIHLELHFLTIGVLNTQCAFFKARNKRSVVVHYAQTSITSWQEHVGSFALKECGIGGDDFYMHDD